MCSFIRLAPLSTERPTQKDPVRGHQASVMFSACRKQVLHSLLHILPTDNDGPARLRPPSLPSSSIFKPLSFSRSQMAGMTNCAPTSLSREGKEAAVVKRSCTLYLLGKREGRTGINIILWCRVGIQE